MYNGSTSKAIKSTPNFATTLPARPKTTIMQEIVERMRSKYSAPNTAFDDAPQELIIKKEVEQLLTRRFIKPNDINHMEKTIQERLGVTTQRPVHRRRNVSTSASPMNAMTVGRNHKQNLERVLSQDYGSRPLPLMQRSQTPQVHNGATNLRELRSSAEPRSQSPNGRLPSPQANLG